jgi:hypothetical protein
VAFVCASEMVVENMPNSTARNTEGLFTLQLIIKKSGYTTILVRRSDLKDAVVSASVNNSTRDSCAGLSGRPALAELSHLNDCKRPHGKCAEALHLHRHREKPEPNRGQLPEIAHVFDDGNACAK